MILADTGYLIALIDHGDELYERALGWTLCVREPVLVTEYVFVETANYFSGTRLRARSHEVLDGLRRNPAYHTLWGSESLFNEGWSLHRDRPDKHWSLTDCISFVVMRQRRITRALAYDHHFEQAGFEPLLRRESRREPRMNKDHSLPASQTGAASTVNPSSSAETAVPVSPALLCVTYCPPSSRSTTILLSCGSTIQYSGTPALA